ncbi:Rad52/Rad22 family DNA repair protein [Rhizobium sp. 21-4511-3d]
MATTEDIKLLFSEFPRDAISWRAQTVTKNGDKAMALAYIDARDVMDRLDSIVGSDNWQDRYEFSGPRTICYLSIKVGDEWITKADGAGDTDVEAEKGAISDAFKRAAVKWGIGRYLYSLPTPWVPCESYESGGKLRWRKWTDDPWNHIRTPNAPSVSAAQMKRGLEEIERDLLDCHTIADVNKLAKSWGSQMDRDGWSKDYRDIATPKFGARRESLQKEAA